MTRDQDPLRAAQWTDGQCRLFLRDDTDVWIASDKAVGDASIQLSDPENSRINAHKAPGHAAQFRRSRRFVRSWLAEYLDRPAHEVAIGLSDLGAPLPFSGTKKPYPSWSRSEGWTALGMSAHPMFGLDIEWARPIEHGVLLETICSDRELDQLAAISGEALADIFWRIWTSKEAILKALGTGFQTPAHELELPIDTLASHDHHSDLLTPFGTTDLMICRRDQLYLAGAWVTANGNVRAA